MPEGNRDFSLVHQVLLPHKAKDSVHPTILYLHGRGADEEDLLGLSGAFDERFLSIAVRAPYRFDYGGGYTWYDILELGKPKQDMFQSSYEKLSQFIDEALAQYPVDPTRLFLFGFSMGTVMAYALALTRPELFAGIVANSGYLAEQTHLNYEWSEIEGKPVLITHGRLDDVIPAAASKRAFELFQNAKARVAYKEYDVAHQLSDRCVADISAWLKERLDSKSTNIHA